MPHIYCVLVREVHVSTMEIEAANPIEAIQKVKDGQGEEVICEYSHTLDPDTWSVDDEKGNEVVAQYPQKKSADALPRPK